MEKKLITLIKQLHHALPFGVRYLYSPILSFFRMLSLYFLRLYHFEGEEYSSGSPLKFVYLGHDKRILSYWNERFFKKKEQIRIKKIIPVWKVKTFLRDYVGRNNISFVIVETNKFLMRFMEDTSGFVLPRWLEMCFDVDKSLRIMERGDTVRRIRKNCLTVEKRNSDKDYNFFYERMFKPFISVRHGESAVIPDYKFFLNKFRKKGSCIYFINIDGKPVAASLLAYKKKKPRLTALGIIDGREDIMRLGVVGALYYFQAADCKRQNIELLYLGGTSPILTDGLTRFKLSLGSELAERKYFGDQFLWFLPCHDSQAVREVLKGNPFISIHKKKFYRNIFMYNIDKNDEINFLNLLEHTKCPNIHSTKVYGLSDVYLLSDWVKKSNCKEIDIIDNKLLIGYQSDK